jgi:phosphomannomutase/phosphoglucomutase
VTFNPRSFREYDIRGVASRDLDDATAIALGRAVAARVAAGSGRQRPRIAIGRDPRLTSPRLFAALAAGVAAGGGHVVDIGVVPTPILYFAAHHLAVEGSVMITGSHNPAEDNGFKLLLGTAALHGDDIARLRDAVAGHLAAGDAAAAPAPAIVEHRDVVPAYLDHAAGALRLGPRRCKVVVDAGNGAGGPAAVELYRRLGFDVVELYCEMDGRFPHHHPDPTQPENVADLQARVAAEGAELGIALDGDADRIGAVDGTGRILWGDQLMILFGKAILAEVPGARFVGEVKCSQAMYDELTRAGGHPEMWKVGHSLIKARLKETGAALGGEMSGHMFFVHRYLGFDDAVYAGARLLELLSRTPRTLAELAAELPVLVNTPELRIECPDERKFDLVRGVTRRLRERRDVTAVVDIDGVRASFGDGWGLVRASNTQPALVIRCEAPSKERLDEIRGIVEGEIAAAWETG